MQSENAILPSTRRPTAATEGSRRAAARACRQYAARILRFPTTFVVRASCGCHAETQLEELRGGSLQAARS